MQQEKQPRAGAAVPGTTRNWNASLGLWLPIAILMLVLLWGAACLLAQAWLAALVPLTAQDLEWASWLPSYSLLDYFNSVAMPVVVLGCCVQGPLLSVVKKSTAPLAAGLITAVLFFGAGGEVHMARVGIAHGSVKVGCYVAESRECARQLGIPAESAPSIYAKPGAGAVYADWYRNALTRQTHLSARDLVLASIPGYYFLTGPLYVFDHKRINVELAKQRAEVARMREAAGVATAAR